MYCSNCGKKLPEASNYCSYCGYNLDENNNINEPPKVDPKFKKEYIGNTITNEDIGQQLNNNETKYSENIEVSISKLFLQPKYIFVIIISFILICCGIVFIGVHFNNRKEITSVENVNNNNVKSNPLYFEIHNIDTKEELSKEDNSNDLPILYEEQYTYNQTSDDFNVSQLQNGTLAVTGGKNISISLKIPASLFGMRVSIINDNAFSTATGQGRIITISEGINRVGDRAFYGYFFSRSISDTNEKIVINLPSTLRSIGIEAFSATALQYSYDKLAYATRGLKYDTFSFIKSLVIPRSVEQVGIGAFNFMTIDYLKIDSAFSISIPRNKNSLNSYTTCVFSDSYFKSIELPGNLTDEWLRNVFSSGKDYMNGFINFYISQGRKAGIYLYNGKIWTFGTRQDVNNILNNIENIQSSDKVAPKPSYSGTTRDPEFQRAYEEAIESYLPPGVLPPNLPLPNGQTLIESAESGNVRGK